VDGIEDHRVSVALSAEECLEVVEQAAELWGADWSRLGTGGRLELPVHAGVRHGSVSARLWTEPDRDGTAIVVRIESSHYRLKTGAVSVLAVGGLGALALTLWPLYPRLLAVAPLALVFSIIAWLVIASRLQSTGVEDFLNLVTTGGEQHAEGRAPDA
jgi:hypothetical protein